MCYLVPPQSVISVRSCFLSNYSLADNYGAVADPRMNQTTIDYVFVDETGTCDVRF